MTSPLTQLGHLRILRFILLAMTITVPLEQLHADDGETPPTSVTADELDRAVTDVISRPEYAWRLPREKREFDDHASIGAVTSFFEDMGEALSKAFRWVTKQIARFFDWLREHFKRPPSHSPGPLNWEGPVQLLLFILLTVTVSILTIFLMRLWRTRKLTGRVNATPIGPSASLLHEEVSADALPSNEWLMLAQELFTRGDLRLALRAMFLSGLAHLGETDIISIALHKSNHEYMREVVRRAHDVSGLVPAFAANVLIIERIWYGLHTPTEELVERFQANYACITAEQINDSTPAPNHGESHEE